MAVAILAARGYPVTASTGKAEAADWLRGLGATEIVGREQVTPSGRPLDKERWAAAVDCVGGDTLAHVLATLRPHGAVAASGNTGGVGLPTTVLPFILRGVSLLGVDSAYCDMALRRQLWRQRMAGDLKAPRSREAIVADEVVARRAAGSPGPGVGRRQPGPDPGRPQPLTRTVATTNSRWKGSTVSPPSPAG